MKALRGLMTGLSFPLIILNILGGITSGIWLAILRDWRPLGLGIGLFFASTLLLGFALMPSLLFAAPAAYFAEKGKTLGVFFFGGLSSLYEMALITIWCSAMLFLFVRDANASDIVPRLIWSYGVATGPWGYMASQEQGPDQEGSASAISAFLAEIAYVVVMLLVMFSGITLLGALKVFGGFMAVGLVVQTTLAVLLQREAASAYSRQ